MKIHNFKYYYIIIALLTISCGSMSFDNPEDKNVLPDINKLFNKNESQIFIFGTDYTSSGQLYVATLDNDTTSLSNSGLTTLGTEAVIHMYNNLLYILHAGGNFNSVSTDNLQIVDPFDTLNPFKTIDQFSTGNATNPLDVVVKDNRAFISLYNPESDSDNVDIDGNPGDVIEMDTNTGIIKHRYSFYDYLNDDGDKNADAYCLLLVDNILYVCLQDLPTDLVHLDPNAPGLIGMIDITTNQILGVITLKGRNPSSLAVSDDHKKLFVSTTYNFEANTTVSGLEVLNLDTLDSELFITDSYFGGYIEKLKASADSVFAIVSDFNTIDFTFESKIVEFPQDITNSNQLSNFLDFSTDIRDAFYQNGYLWASYRVISTSEGDSSPAVKVYDVQTGEQVGQTVFPIVAGISLTGL